MTTAEEKAYQRGYAAGRRKAGRMTDGEFYDAALLQLLPVAMEAEGWTMNGAKVANSDQRTELACRWVQRALKERNSRGPQ